MSIRHFPVIALCALGGLSLWGCEKPQPVEASTGSTAVAQSTVGVVTQEEVEREVQRLPPELRERFETEAGRREFTRSLMDKRLLAHEAARRGFAQDPEIRRQVKELEERLTIKAMLAQEERALPPITDAEARAFYEASKERFAEPELRRVARVFVAVPPGSPRAQWNQARQRAEAFRRKLLAGEPVANVARSGEGPERARGGELGLLGPGQYGSAALEKAALALSKAGQVSTVVEEPAGASVVVLLELRPARVPPFEDVKQVVLGRMTPLAQRRVFEQVLTRLRSQAGVQLAPADEVASNRDTVVAP